MVKAKLTWAPFQASINSLSTDLGFFDNSRLSAHLLSLLPGLESPIEHPQFEEACQGCPKAFQLEPPEL